MTTDLDQIVAHANFEEAFGIRRGTRLHEGLSPGYQSLGVGFDTGSETRRGLLADFAEAVILRYLAAPRVSLIGHPGFE